MLILLMVILGLWLFALVVITLFSIASLYDLKEVPLKERCKAVFQWVSVFAVISIAYVAGVVMAFIATLTAKRGVNDFDEDVQAHSLKYIEQGSSGIWEYWSSNIPIVRYWSNYEDGDLGEPSGKQSVRCKGKESSFWNRYFWNAFRNPFNRGKRTIPFFHCLVDDCELKWWGDEVVSDKYKGGYGWQFVRATHKKTGKVYFGYYSVKGLKNNKVRVSKLGFKIKPSHAFEQQDADDKDKAFTFRYQHASEIN